MFPLARERPAAGARGAGEGARRHREGQPDEIRRQLSAHAFRRHEAARRDRARHGDGARHPADGRAVRGARRADAPQDAGRAARSCGTTRASRCCSSRIRLPEAIKIGSRILLLSPHPGQVKAELNSLPRDADARRQRCARSSRRSTRCSSPTPSKHEDAHRMADPCDPGAARSATASRSTPARVRRRREAAVGLGADRQHRRRAQARAARRCSR